MNAYIAAVHHKHRGAVEVLLGQKNIYLPPHGRFQFAAIGRNAVQYVLPGGVVAPGETIERAAIREFHEATGVELHASALKLFYSDSTAGDHFFRVDYDHARGHHGVELINLAIGEGRTASLAYNHFAWFTIESAQCALGNKHEYQQLPWVTGQIMRALNAGFSGEYINMRANDNHARFACALAKLLLDVLEPRPHGEPPSTRSEAT
jgi:ADP-ribose pyrophosphatase YjhB (NUDIX family)